MRTGLVLLLAAWIGICAAAACASSSDRGSSRPPVNLSDSSKTLWMTEWVACHHTKLGALAKSVGVRIRSGSTPQLVARLIAKKAEALLYDTTNGLGIAVDGCREGILWRYYHGT